MVCLPCLAAPALLLSSGSAMTASSKKIFVWSIVVSVLIVLVYWYYTTYKKCKTCK